MRHAIAGAFFTCLFSSAALSAASVEADDPFDTHQPTPTLIASNALPLPTANAQPITLASAAAQGPRIGRPRTESTLKCLLGVGDTACGENNGCNHFNGPIEQVSYLGTNAAAADVYVVRYRFGESTYVIAQPGPDGKIGRAWSQWGNPNGIVPSSLVKVLPPSIPVLIYTRPENARLAKCLGNAGPDLPGSP